MEKEEKRDEIKKSEQENELEKEAVRTIYPNEEEIEKDIYLLRVPIVFEGHEIDRLDLSKMADLRGRDLESAKRLMRKLGMVPVTNTGTPTEYMWSTEFLLCLFQSTTGITMDIINELHSIDYILLVGRLSSFLMRTVSTPRKIS